MGRFYPASFFLESEKRLVLKQIHIPTWSKWYNVIEWPRALSQLKFSEILFVWNNSSAKQYENIIAILRIWSLSMMEMEFLRYITTSTMLMFLPIHYLIISADWSENPHASACSTSSVVNCTNNKWYTLSRDFCRQIGTDI